MIEMVENRNAMRREGNWNALSSVIVMDFVRFPIGEKNWPADHKKRSNFSSIGQPHSARAINGNHSQSQADSTTFTFFSWQITILLGQFVESVIFTIFI